LFRFVSLLARTNSKTVPFTFPKDVYIQETADGSDQNNEYSLPYVITEEEKNQSPGFLYFLERIVAAISLTTIMIQTTKIERGRG